MSQTHHNPIGIPMQCTSDHDAREHNSLSLFDQSLTEASNCHLPIKPISLFVEAKIIAFKIDHPSFLRRGAG
jgi:hypothetical protein